MANRTRTGSNSNKLGKKKDITQEAPWICTGCDKALEDNSSEVIECHNCKQWCHSHNRCSDLTKHQFECLKEGGNFILWLCPKCRHQDRTETQDRVETKLDCVLKLLQNLTARMDSMEDNHKACSTEAIDTKISQAVEKKVEEYLGETQEKEKRKLNIIITNLPESQKDTPEDRRDDDISRVLTFVRKATEGERINLEELENPVRLGGIRIGSNVRPRPLKMTVKDETTKMTILRNAFKANKDVQPLNRIYINEDSTPKEREKFRKLRAELTERRDRGEQNLMINYREGKIVERSPRNLTSETRQTQVESGPDTNSSEH